MVEAGLASVVSLVVVSIVAGWFRQCWFPWWCESDGGRERSELFILFYATVYIILKIETIMRVIK